MTLYAPLRLALLSLFLLPLLLCMDRSVSAPETTQKVAILTIVEHPALNATRQGIVDTLKDNNVQVMFQSAQGNSALATQIAQQFVGSKPDILVGLGTSATQALISADQYSQIPIVFSSVTDPKGAKLVNEKVTGVSNYIDPTIQFTVFKEILPNLSKLGIIYNPGDVNSVALVQQMEKIAPHLKITLVLATANSTADITQATHRLMEKVDAIFINNDNTALAAFESIIKISNIHLIPVFASDTAVVKQGALAALGANPYEIGKQSAEMMIKILHGESPHRIPILYTDKTELFINFAQVNRFKLKLKESLLQKAHPSEAQSHE